MTFEITDIELWEGGNLIGGDAKVLNMPELFNQSRKDVLADMAEAQQQLAGNDNEGDVRVKFASHFKDNPPVEVDRYADGVADGIALCLERLHGARDCKKAFTLVKCVQLNNEGGRYYDLIGDRAELEGLDK